MHELLPVNRLRSSAILAVAAVACTGNAQADTTIDAYYRGDMLHNSSGGLREGGAYLDDAGIRIDSDLEALFGGADGRVFAYLLYNNRATFSDRFVGDLQVASNIDARDAVRIYELWYEQSWSDRYSLRFGLYDLNAEFDAIDTAGLFMNSSHGIGGEFGQTGEAGPSIFPVTSLAARFEWQVSAAATLRFALLDGVPGDPADPGKTTIDLDADDGLLQALEYNHVLPGGLRLGLGGWWYSAEFDRLRGVDGNGDPLRKDGNNGYYGFAELPQLKFGSGDTSLSVFLRYGIANDDINVLQSYFGGGLVATGLLRSRPQDQLGLAFASASVGGPYRRAQADAGDRSDRAETSIELTYSAQLTEWLRVQPDIQYIINPGANPALDNALVFGLQFSLARQLFPSAP